jgi:hypothetical protein
MFKKNIGWLALLDGYDSSLPKNSLIFLICVSIITKNLFRHHNQTFPDELTSEPNLSLKSISREFTNKRKMKKSKVQNHLWQKTSNSPEKLYILHFCFFSRNWTRILSVSAEPTLSNAEQPQLDALFVYTNV